MSFTCKGMTFLAFCFNFVIELSTFLFVVTCTSNFANTNTTSTNRFIYISDRTKDISDTKHSFDFLIVKLWILLLFSKRCYMAGRTSCFPRRKVNRNFDITSGFEDLTSRSFQFVWMVPSKNARAFTGHWGDLKRVEWWEDIRSTLTTPPFVWS